MSDIVVSPLARDRQRRAADPERSVWVSANAGAGKTKVLTDRVIRLMLAGAPPARILCLTFTKAAAAEMTIRVFETLGDWVTLDDAALGEALTEMTGERHGAAVRARARRLFARAVETPGGLKIETIHAFCERLLHLVPFEAGVPARFAVLDDAQAAELATEARAAVLTAAASGDRLRPDRHHPSPSPQGRAESAKPNRGGDGPAGDPHPGSKLRFDAALPSGEGQGGMSLSGPLALAEALDVVASQLSGPKLLELIDRAAADPRVPGEAEEVEHACARLADAMGVLPGETPDDLRREATEGGIAPAEWPAIAAELRATGSSRDAERAEALRLAGEAPDLASRLVHYDTIFFKKTDGKPRAAKDIATKALPAPLRDALAAEQERLVGLRPRLLAADAVARSRALFTLAGAVRARTAILKRRLGALDFADLITRTLDLFERGAGPWVLYKLDRGIDHLLVDEAQDTNAEQWQILRRLTEEFTAGAGRPARMRRTVFAVGDPKQSIYSFQGADPRLFEDSRRHWMSKHAAAGLGFEDIRLDLSFRSAQTVLHAVDHTFRVAAHYRGLSFADDAVGTTHEAARRDAPGAVEIWPTEMPSEKLPDVDAWSLPVDLPDPGSPASRIAARVAQAVKSWTNVPDPATGRIWRPGEILILARKRGPAFFAAIRALKAAGVPVAGADRLDLGGQIAINDLVAAGQAAILPQNDLVLAAALKSPLVGLDDDDLVRIAADRPVGTSLVDALEAAAGAGDARAAAAFAAVSGWRSLARRHGPFGFYATLLGPHGGRRRLVERLGGEAADTIDVFLCRAEAEEGGLETPSLTSFLSRFETASHVVKRDPEAAGDEVRVMTVHGAKGLEAPLVVVLDGCEVGGQDPDLVGVPVGHNGEIVPVWAPGASGDPPLVAAARVELQARGLEEHNRLLYVALTRARDRLVLAPFAGRGREPPEAWCAMVRRGFAEATAALVRTETPYGPVELWRDGKSWTPAAPGRPSAGLPPLPDWLLRPVAPEPESLPPLRPSGPLPAADRPAPVRLASPERGAARRRGILVHALVDHLAGRPAADRPDAAAAYLSARAPALDESVRGQVAAEALRVVGHPALAPLFGPGSRGEVALSGWIGRGGSERVVAGQIDRLAIEPDAITVADFKTGAMPADGRVAEPYLAQLAIYRALLAEAYPGRPIRTLLVWTAGPTVVEPTADEIARALDAVLP